MSNPDKKPDRLDFETADIKCDTGAALKKLRERRDMIRKMWKLRKDGLESQRGMWLVLLIPLVLVLMLFGSFLQMRFGPRGDEYFSILLLAAVVIFYLFIRLAGRKDRIRVLKWRVIVDTLNRAIKRLQKFGPQKVIDSLDTLLRQEQPKGFFRFLRPKRKKVRMEQVAALTWVVNSVILHKSEAPLELPEDEEDTRKT